jgi:hypothetical protein
MRIIHILLLLLFWMIPAISFSQQLQHLDQRTISNSQIKTKRDLEAQAVASKCYDLAYSGLEQDAKTILIDAIYDSTYKEYESYLRFSLGQICFELNAIDCAKFQWNIISSKFPESEEAAAIRIIYGMFGWAIEDIVSDYKFSQEYELSTWFWNKSIPDFKTDPQEFVDPKLAVRYLQELYNRYDDENKRIIILNDLFLLFMGFNDNKFGYSHADEGGADNPSVEYYKFYKIAKGEGDDLALNLNITPQEREENIQKKAKTLLLSLANAVSDSFKTFKIGKAYYIRSQFLIGVTFCGSKWYSSKIKIVDNAIPYFQNVIKATEGEETNIFRLFAIKWVAKVK